PSFAAQDDDGNTRTQEAPAPRLTGLRVEGVDGSLQPAFDPERLRYSVRAPEPAGLLALPPAPGDRLELTTDNGQVATDQRFVVRNAQPQTELTIEVRNEPGEARTYTVVYLPAHFPKLVVTVDETTASRDPLYVNLTQLGTAYFIAKLDN